MLQYDRSLPLRSICSGHATYYRQYNTSDVVHANGRSPIFPLLTVSLIQWSLLDAGTARGDNISVLGRLRLDNTLVTVNYEKSLDKPSALAWVYAVRKGYCTGQLLSSYAAPSRAAQRNTRQTTGNKTWAVAICASQKWTSKGSNLRGCELDTVFSLGPYAPNRSLPFSAFWNLTAVERRSTCL